MTSRLTFFEKDMTIEKTIITKTNTAKANYRTTYWLSLPGGKAAKIEIESNTIIDKDEQLNQIMNSYNLNWKNITKGQVDMLIRPQEGRAD